MSEKVKDILEWVYCIIIALVLALLFRYYVATPTIVQQRSMFPTLKHNERLILDRTFRITHKKPQIGDIVTFEAPSRDYEKYNADQTNPIAIYDNEPTSIVSKFFYYCIEVTKKSYIKRVIALEGDHVKIEDNVVYVNGIPQEEKYLSEDVVTESSVFYDFIVPEGYFFAMGDNRTKSKDCRDIGCIPFEKLEGVVRFRFWPFSEFGKID